MVVGMALVMVMGTQQSIVGFNGRGFGFSGMKTQQSIGVGRVDSSGLVFGDSFDASTWKKSEAAGGLMSLEGGGSLEVDVINLVGGN
jgi:hypothetical protein